MGSVDQYIPYVEAGADEVFCGFVPYEWNRRYRNHMSLNRREVRYYPVQLGSHSELRILRRQIDRYHVPVTITLNSLYYLPRQYEEICGIVEEGIKMGYESYIVADPALILYLRNNLKCPNLRLHLSGEFGEMNSGMAGLWKEWGIERVIFHRKVSLENMSQIIQSCGPLFQFEAFALNEKCHYHGGYCNSIHCDELTHSCRLPWKAQLRGSEEPVEETDVLGAGGCSICALYDLKEMGIEYLKLVTRGNFGESTLEDIRAMKKAVMLLEDCPDRKTAVNKLKKELFPEGCSGNCYYPDQNMWKPKCSL